MEDLERTVREIQESILEEARKVYPERVIELFLSPRNLGPLPDPDGYARFTGPCGDTMEITLKVKDGMVISAGYWASGCGPSSACGAMATQLATGKSVDDIPEIVDHEAIEKAVGGLPEDKVHCAQLAADTLVEALHQYFIRQRKNTS